MGPPNAATFNPRFEQESPARNQGAHYLAQHYFFCTGALPRFGQGPSIPNAAVWISFVAVRQ
jgi:hypothetical protein